MAYCPVGGILHGPVPFHMADCPVPGVLHCAIVLNVSDCPISRILHGAVGFQMPYRPVGRVLNGAVRSDVPDGPVSGVLDSTVGLDEPYGPVSAVGYLLGMAEHAGQQQRKQYGQDSLHHFSGVPKRAFSDSSGNGQGSPSSLARFSEAVALATEAGSKHLKRTLFRRSSLSASALAKSGFPFREKHAKLFPGRRSSPL